MPNTTTTIENHKVVVMEHDLVVDGTSLSERKQLTDVQTEDGSAPPRSIMVHTRKIGDRSLEVKEVRVDGEVKETTISTEMSNKEVKKFQKEWQEKWCPTITDEQIANNEVQMQPPAETSRPSTPSKAPPLTLGDNQVIVQGNEECDPIPLRPEDEEKEEKKSDERDDSKQGSKSEDRKQQSKGSKDSKDSKESRAAKESKSAKESKPAMESKPAKESQPAKESKPAKEN